MVMVNGGGGAGAPIKYLDPYVSLTTSLGEVVRIKFQTHTPFNSETNLLMTIPDFTF